MNHALHASWQRAWHGIGAHGEGRVWLEQLVACYGQAHRHYHTLQHLHECLDGWEDVRALAQYPHEVELALWFHDAIYELKRSDNERRSADWASQVLRAAAVDAASVTRVHALIMATEHTAVAVGTDAQLLVDIDLSILGAPPARFAEYEAQIRREYAFVPQVLFTQRRRAILRGFLQRPQVYLTPVLHQRLEAQARQNLKQAIGG